MVSVNWAFFGVPSTFSADPMCPNPPSTPLCFANTSMEVVGAQCINRSFCNLPNRYIFYSYDPCPRQLKKVGASLVCGRKPVAPALTRTRSPPSPSFDLQALRYTMCFGGFENTVVRANCTQGPNDYFESVNAAFFGQFNGTSLCPSPVPDTQCQSNGTIPVVERACLRKNSCLVPSTRFDYNPDPCPWKRKSVVAILTCVHRPTSLPLPLSASAFDSASPMESPSPTPMDTDVFQPT